MFFDFLLYRSSHLIGIQCFEFGKTVMYFFVSIIFLLFQNDFLYIFRDFFIYFKNIFKLSDFYFYPMPFTSLSECLWKDKTSKRETFRSIGRINPSRRDLKPRLFESAAYISSVKGAAIAPHSTQALFHPSQPRLAFNLLGIRQRVWLNCSRMYL